MDNGAPTVEKWNSPLLDAALEYAAHGKPVFPCNDQKRPLVAGGFNAASTDAEQIKAWWGTWPNAFIGMPTGERSGICVVDIDIKAGVDGYASIPDWESLSPLIVRTRSGGAHLYFVNHPGLRNSVGRFGPGLDVRAAGGYVVVPPSPGYGFWKGGLIESVNLPPWPERFLESAPLKSSAIPGPTIDRRFDFNSGRDIPEGQRNSALTSFAGAMRRRGMSAREIAAALLAVNAMRCKPPLEEAEVCRIAESVARYASEESQTNLEGERRHAQRGMPELLSDVQGIDADNTAAISALVTEAALLDPVESDRVLRAIKQQTGTGMGALRRQYRRASKPCAPDQLRLARMVAIEIGPENILYTDGSLWEWRPCGVWQEADERALKQRLQRRAEAEIESVNAAYVNGALDLFKNEILIQNHKFNLGNPESVNCLNGELELTDEGWTLRDHRRELYRTTQIPVAYDPEARAPLFLWYLGQAFRDDLDNADKRKALLELIGYTLMSHARHEKFVILIGAGANGKSVLLSLLEALCGVDNVAGVQPSNFDRAFQRAHLHQKLANLVTELHQGEIIADAELKAITSGEPSTVEHKFGAPFVMRPFATCWFATNHLPHTRDFSDALFRRAVILTFNRSFAAHEQDPLLKDQLKAELPGVLTIALRAYARALRNGFTEPESSKAAKDDWRLEADQVAQFVKDCCARDPSGQEPIRDVYFSYGTWASGEGITKLVSKKGLRDRLTRLGFKDTRTSSARYVVGLRLNPPHLRASQ